MKEIIVGKNITTSYGDKIMHDNVSWSVKEAEIYGFLGGSGTGKTTLMKTMGFEPFNFLVLPRIIAMVLCVPVIIFIADAISILGQMIICQTILDISFSDYLNRFREMVELRHFAVGMIKAPFFGAVIAIIGCMRGFGVSQNAQSLGAMTTVSVVNAIFWVIALDAFFAIIFMWLKI